MTKAIIALIVVLFAMPASGELVVSGGVATSSTVRFHDPEAAAVEVSWITEKWTGIDVSAGWIGDQEWVDSFAYLSVQKTFRFPVLSGRLFGGVGGVLRTDADGIDEVLSSPLSFSLSVGADFGPVRVQYRHASNAGLKDPNYGQNWLLAGYRF